MLGTIRISGRLIDTQVLERLSRQSQGPSPPSRRELIETFCRAVHWEQAKGQPAISSASVALARLENRGLVKLPPKLQRPPAQRPRGLRDDGQPLPPLPRLPSGGRAIAGLKLRLIENQQDPAHLVWNRLIVREHPLGRRPLVGRQLRYLAAC
jgi:hypothetical protein